MELAHIGPILELLRTTLLSSPHVFKDIRQTSGSSCSYNVILLILNDLFRDWPASLVSTYKSLLLVAVIEFNNKIFERTNVPEGAANEMY